MEKSFNNEYFTNGVTLSPSTPSPQSITKITYRGLLLQNGATDVYAHVGYGYRWENATDYKMTKTGQGFEVSIPIDRNTETLNLCFKDAANNWDNNAGANYTFAVRPLNVNYSFDFEHEVSMKR